MFRVLIAMIIIASIVIISLNNNKVVGDTNLITSYDIGGIPVIGGKLAIKSVHVYAPNIILMTFNDKNAVYTNNMLFANEGPELQQGVWEISRSNGSQMRVLNVYRHTLPAGQPDYSLGFGNAGHINNNLLDLEHNLFIVLGENIGNNETLDIKGPKGIRFDFSFDDEITETPIIKVNQAAYHPSATERWAYMSGWMGDGGALALDNFPNHAEIFQKDAVSGAKIPLKYASLELRSPFDAESGAAVAQINISWLTPSESAYFIRIPGVGVSMPFYVSEKESYKSFYTTARGLFHNRWAGDLRPEFTNWSRPQDFHNVYKAESNDFYSFFPENAPTNERVNLIGGYHDAGDFDQRPFHTIVPMLLMRAYEISPEFFTDSQLNIPESNNGFPDLLDEALWGIKAWEQLQEENGCVRLGVESYRHPWGIYFADQDPLPYWTYSCEPRHTARVAGLFAQASRLVKDYNNELSENLKARAISAYNYSLISNITGGPMLYASGELYRITGESEYKEKFESVFRSMGQWNGAFDHFSAGLPWGSSYTIDVQPATGDYLLGYLQSKEVNEEIYNLSNRKFREFASDAVNNLKNSHAYRNPRPTGQGIDWGKGTAAGEYLIPIYSLFYFQNLSRNTRQEYFNAISMSSDFVLGANPDGFVYITGLGFKNPKQPLHLDSLSFIKQGKGPMPGIPVFGPVESLPEAEYYDQVKAAFYPKFEEHPLMLKYADTRASVNTNEFDVTVQAIHTQLFSLLASLGNKLKTGYLNNIPVISRVLLSSADILERRNGTLIGSWLDTDFDGDAITASETKWYNGSAEVLELANSTFLPPHYTNKKELWIFSIRVYDGLNWSKWKNSTQIRIKNAKPSIAIANTQLVIRETEAAEIPLAAFDIDNDTLAFYINSTLFSLEDNALKWLTNISSGDDYNFKISVNDGEDIDSILIGIKIIDEKDFDDDGNPDFKDDDDDNDGVNDHADYIKGSVSSIKSEIPVDMKINGKPANLSGMLNGTHNLIIGNGSEPILDFNWTFNETNILDLSLINITSFKNGSSAIIISGIDLSRFNFTKTVYIDKLNTTAKSVCIKDMENITLSNFTSNCTGLAETLAICDNSTNFYSCFDFGSRYKITGLKHSGVIEQCRDNDGDGYGEGCSAGADCNDNSASQTVSCSSYSPQNSQNQGGGGGSGGGRGGSSGGGGSAMFICNKEWQCSEWSECFNGLQKRNCDFIKINQRTQNTPCQYPVDAPQIIKICVGKGKNASQKNGTLELDIPLNNTYKETERPKISKAVKREIQTVTKPALAGLIITTLAALLILSFFAYFKLRKKAKRKLLPKSKNNKTR